MMIKLAKIVQSTKFSNFILLIIISNAVILGLDTIKLDYDTQYILSILDKICLYIFIIEIIVSRQKE